MNLYMSDTIEKVLHYSAILSAIQNHSSNRIEIWNRKRRRRRRNSNSKNLRITTSEIHSASTACFVWCSHQTHFNRQFRTSSTWMYARIVAASCLILCSSRTIHSMRTRFLMISWRDWSFQLQMIQFACWKWFSKSETRQRKWTRSITSNVIWLTNFKTKERFCEKE